MFVLLNSRSDEVIRRQKNFLSNMDILYTNRSEILCWTKVSKGPMSENEVEKSYSPIFVKFMCLTSNIWRFFTGQRSISGYNFDGQKKHVPPLFWRDTQRFSSPNNLYFQMESKNCVLTKITTGPQRFPLTINRYKWSEIRISLVSLLIATINWKNTFPTKLLSGT